MEGSSEPEPRLAALVRASSALAALSPDVTTAAVLDALYRQAATLVDVLSFLVSLYDRDAGLLRCGFAIVDGTPWPLEDFPPLPLGQGPTSRVIRTGQPVIVRDVRTEPGPWNRRVIGDGPEIRSMLLAPMMRGGDVIGVVQAQSGRVGAYSPDDAAALSVLANQAAAAMDAASRRAQAERTAGRARLLADTSRMLGESLDLNQVLDALAGRLAVEVGAGCAVYLLTEHAERYAARAVRYRDPALRALDEGALGVPPPSVAAGFIGRLLLRGEPMQVADIDALALPDDLAVIVRAMGVRQALLVPMRRRGQILGGILVLGTAAWPLGDDDFDLVESVADRAAAAIDHARLHAELTDQHRFLTHLIEAAPLAIAVVRGPDYVFEIANAAYRAHLPGGDPIGRPIAEMAQGAFNASVIQQGRELLNRVLDTGKPIRVADVPARMPRDGRRRYLTFDLSPLPPEGERPAGVLLLVWDTTNAVLARQRLEELARQSAAHAAELEAIIAGMAEGVMVTGADGSIRLLNPAGRDLLGPGLPPEPVPPWEMLSRMGLRLPGGEPVSEEELRALWETDRPILGRELRLPAAGGAARVIRMSVAPIPAPDGARAGAVAIFEDVTERLALEQARERFIAQASHELRTPLTSLLGYLQLVQRRLARRSAEASVTEMVGHATDQAARMRELLNDLLETSRIQQGRLVLRPETTDLTALLAGVVDEYRRHTDDHAHTFHLETPATPVTGVWDAERLRQVFANLLDNAVKYSPTGGNVWLCLQDRGREVVVSVRDEGIGIPAGEIPKLFRPFGRAEHPPAQNIPGFGLGLFICREIVERHGGTLGVTSRPGEGSTFTVMLPKQGAKHPGSEGMPAGEALHLPTSNPSSLPE